MRDGRSETPRFNAAVDVAHVQKPGAKLLGESAERKKDFSEISAYRNGITRRGNRRHAAEQRDELASCCVEHGLPSRNPLCQPTASSGCPGSARRSLGET